MSMRVAVIGGGAAGLAAAISAARCGARVIIYEASKRVGQKILKTGNGRCNLTNAYVRPTDYNESTYIAPFIENFTTSRILDFFDEIGLLTVEEDQGRIYPLSNSASTVLNVLRYACERYGVETLCEHEVTNIKKTPDGSFALKCANGSRHEADRVIVSTGGGTKLLSCLGHKIVPFEPILCPLRTDTRVLKGLSGIRAQAKVSAYESADAEEAYAWMGGEVLFRDYGLSGIVIFDLTREVKAGDYLGIDFLPQVTEQQCLDWLTANHELMRSCALVHGTAAPTYAELLCGEFHTRINEAIIRRSGNKPTDTVKADRLAKIAAIAKNYRVQVLGLAESNQAQVTRGGAAIDEFDQFTLESKRCPGLYGAGETLDIDGRCGGFNLHWAWASGIATGAAASQEASVMQEASEE